MTTTVIIIAFAAFLLGIFFGFLTAGLMAEARKNDNAEKGGTE